MSSEGCDIASNETEAQTTVDALRNAIHRSRNAQQADAFSTTAALDELDAWLRDDRQWSRGQVQHWRDLIDDLTRLAGEIKSLARGPRGSALENSINDLRRIRGGLGGARDRVPDEADRRMLGRASASLRRAISAPSLTSDAWSQITRWAREDPMKADHAIVVLADLLTLRDHKGWDLVDHVDRTLGNKNLDVSLARGHRGPVADVNSSAGASPSERLNLAKALIENSSPARVSIVWLEFVQATLRHPPVLPLGENVVLVNGDFLRQAMRHPQDFWELPSELSSPDSIFRVWFGDHTESDSGEPEPKDGDPRVYARIVVAPQAPKRALQAARLTAAFLVAYGALNGDNRDTWILANNYAIADDHWSIGGYSFNAEQSRRALSGENTAATLARQAELLGPRLPISEGNLETAARLAIWLQDAVATDNPARVLLCDRVIEQVCGWAGFGEPSRFISAVIRPSWIYGELRREIDDAWWSLRSDLGNVAPPRLAEIEIWRPHPPHASIHHIGPAFDPRVIIERLDELTDAAPHGSRSARQLSLLRERATQRRAMSRRLDELEATFERRDRRLRRTRNALMHGGPLARRTVDDSATFAEVLARHALSPAVDFLLACDDLIDAFASRAESAEQSLRALREGVHPRYAMFPD
jgi:hypothetical protein